MNDSNISKTNDRPDEPAPPAADRDEVAGDVDARRLEDSAAALGGSTPGAAARPDDELSHPNENERDERRRGSR